MSVLTYNDITLPYASSVSFSQSEESEESGTDRLYTKYEIEVLATLNYRYARAVAKTLFAGVFVEQENAATLMYLIRNKLMERRKKLSYKFNGFELIPEVEGRAGVGADAMNGPIPQHCDLTRLDNETFLLQYKVIARYCELPNLTTLKNKEYPAVIYNRWTETVDIDDCNYTIRTRDGKIKIRSDNPKAITPDQFRSQCCVCSVPEGFLRKSSKYTLSSDGLSLAYTIVDQEYFKAPPDPAFKAEGFYAETSNILGCNMKYGTVRVKLKGDKLTSQTKLLDTAIAACSSKLKIIGAPLNIQGAGRGQPVNMSVKSDMYNNEVDVSVTALIPVGTARIHGMAGLTSRMTQTPFSDETEPFAPSYQAYGTASILLQSAALFDPSLANTKLVGGPIVTPSNPITFTGDDKTKTEGTKPGEAGA